MTDKLDLSEEIAALRRTVAAQAVMLKATMNKIGQFETLELQQSTVSAWAAHARRLDALEKLVGKTSISDIEDMRDSLDSLKCLTPEIKESKIRLQILENWQLNVNEILTTTNTPASPLPSGPSDYVPANDNNPPKPRPQKLKLLDEIDAVLKGHKRGIVSGDIWMLLTDLDAVLDQHRQICHE